MAVYFFFFLPILVVSHAKMLEQDGLQTELFESFEGNFANEKFNHALLGNFLAKTWS